MYQKYNKLYDYISKWCFKNNISICQLESRAGIPNGIIRTFKSKVKGPTFTVLIKLANVMEISLDDFANIIK